MAVKLQRLKGLIGHWLSCVADNRKLYYLHLGYYGNKHMHLAAVAMVVVECRHDAPETNL